MIDIINMLMSTLNFRKLEINVFISDYGIRKIKVLNNYESKLTIELSLQKNREEKREREKRPPPPQRSSS